VQVGQKHFFGDYASAKMYRSDETVFDEGGNLIIAEIVTPPVSMGLNPFILDAVLLDVLTGVGVNSTTDSDANPKLMLDYSDDGGASFGGLREIDLGAAAQRHLPIIERQFGRFDFNGLSFRLRCSARVVKGFLSAQVMARKLALQAA
jgi:hypothetical protein